MHATDSHKWSHISLLVLVLTFISANRGTAFDFEQNDVEGIPDGMAIDTEGNLWVACFSGGQVSAKHTIMLYKQFILYHCKNGAYNLYHIGARKMILEL
jgi:sugar lactone lactonase YvrE